MDERTVNILALSGSPVEGSSTDFLLEQLTREVTNHLDNVDVQTRFVRLNDLHFIPCQACGKAPAVGDFCLFDDDLTTVYRHVVACDLLLIGSPIYFDSVSAQVKAFIDRCNCFRPPDYDNTEPNHDFLKRLDRERLGAMVLVGGEKGWFEGARRTIAGFFKWLDIINSGTLVFHSKDYNLSGEARHDKAALADCRELGLSLAKAIRELESRQH